MSFETDVSEKLGVVGQMAQASHSRIDKLEGVIREDLAKLNEAVSGLLAEMHKAQGRNGVILFVIGALGAVMGAIFSIAATIIFK